VRESVSHVGRPIPLKVVEECPGFSEEAALAELEDLFEGGDHGAEFVDFGGELVDAMLESPAFALVRVVH